MTLRVATRRSTLARWQAGHVGDLVRRRHPEVDIDLVAVETLGDQALDRPISDLGGRGAFVKEVQAAVLDGRADLAVHSAKDLPSNPQLGAEGLRLVAVPERGDPRDALVGRPLAAIPPGGVVATGSARRRAQLAHLRPDLTFVGLRGSIETRLAKAGGVSAVVVAAAALERLGRGARAAEVLDPAVVLPQVGQGALAVECRADDNATMGLLAGIDHGPSRRAVDGERAFLARLGGSCELPTAAYGTERADGSVWIRALLASLDGRMVLRTEAVVPRGADPAGAGARLAQDLLDRGGRSLLEEAGAGWSRR
ncbi:MAG: hydroxymethylbilane synthase [Acidimicrobiales bacterium]